MYTDDCNVLTDEQPAAIPTRFSQPPAVQPRIDAPKKLRDHEALFAALAVVDQAVVSGTRFLATLFVGRLCSPSELGVYSLGFSIIVLVANIQDSLVSGPFFVYQNRLDNERRAWYAGSTFIQQLALSAIVAALLALAAGLSGLLGMSPGSSVMIWTMAGVIPLASLYEFARRFCFAKLSVPTALIWDLVVSGLQMGMMFLVWRNGHLSAATAMFAMGAGSALAGGAWFWQHRAEFRVDRTRIRADWRQNLAFGRWALFSQSIDVTNGYYLQWFLAFTLGTAATGIYSASMTIVQFAHPLTLGISNVLGPAAARAFHKERQRGVRRVVMRGFMFLAASVGTYCLAIAFFGPDILRLLFGKEFVHDRNTVIVLAGATFLATASMAANAGLWALDLPRLSSLTSLFGFAVICVSSWLLVGRLGVLGAACSTLIAGAAGALTRAVCFSQLTRTPRSTT
jgi:O-antigen/teichoic acid export membrane protein